MLANTLAAINAQLRKGDRILVVADNCDDATAAIARHGGAEVVARNDAMRRGKGYALDFGMRVLDQAPPDIVIMIDADCYVHDGAIDALVGQVIATGQPAPGLLSARTAAPRQHARSGFGAGIPGEKLGSSAGT